MVVCFVVMIPAQWQAPKAYVVNLLSVAAHAHPVHVVQVAGLAAYRALFAHQAGVYISLNVLAQLNQRNMGRHIIGQHKLYQVADVFPGRCHVAI